MADSYICHQRQQLVASDARLGLLLAISWWRLAVPVVDHRGADLGCRVAQYRQFLGSGDCTRKQTESIDSALIGLRVILHEELRAQVKVGQALRREVHHGQRVILICFQILQTKRLRYKSQLRERDSKWESYSLLDEGNEISVNVAPDDVFERLARLCHEQWLLFDESIIT